MNQTMQSNALSQSDAQQYWEDGFVFPVRVFSSNEAEQYRNQLEDIEQSWINADLPRPLSQYIRSHSETVMPFAAQMAHHPAVLDAVESLLGENIMIWGAEFFIKEAQSNNIVSMHQDLTYWGFGETSDQVTAWIALSPATVQSGCMDLVKGSHKNAILPHTETHAENNMLSRGQEVNVNVSDADITAVELQPGEMSLHHGQTIHGSKPNTSNDRRIGFAIRYITPQAVQQTDIREYAMLARGIDSTQRFIHYATPAALFSKNSVALYEKIRNQQDQVLTAGLTDKHKLYS